MVFMLNGAHVCMRIMHVFRYLCDPVSIFCCATLSQVHVGESTVSSFGPWVSGRFRVHVQLHVAELINPPHQVAIRIRIATTLTAAHGNPHHISLVDLLHSCQSSNLAIIDDLERHISCHLL